MAIHEFISTTFSAGLSLDEQQRTMDGLDAAVRRQPGFRSRECFYSKADGRWMVHIAWEDEDAVEGSDAMVGDPAVSDLYDGFDVQTMTYGRYEQRSPVH
jgi:hypothetical protein